MDDEIKNEDRMVALAKKLNDQTATPEEKVEFLRLLRDLAKDINADIDKPNE